MVTDNNRKQLQYAVQNSWLVSKQATECFVKSTRQGRPFYEVALELGYISEHQANALSTVDQHGGTEIIRPQVARSGAGQLFSPGRKIGPYRVLRLIGRGGMAEVFEVEKDSEVFALKVMSVENAKDTDFKRFKREAQCLKKLGFHDNIVTFYDYQGEHDPPYIVMQYVPGQTLEQVLRENGQWNWRQAAELVAKLASALHFAHEKGHSHRDLKPANIIIRESDKEPILTDFGLAKSFDADTLTGTQEWVGTLRYMAPERFGGNIDKSLAPRGDIWALGILLYRMIAGQLPFQGHNTVEVMTNILFGAASGESIFGAQGPQMQHILNMCLQKAPMKRYASAQQLAQDLNSVLKTGKLSATRRPLLNPQQKKAAVALGIAAAILIFACIFALIIVLNGNRAGEKTAQLVKAFGEPQWSANAIVAQQFAKQLAGTPFSGLKLKEQAPDNLALGYDLYTRLPVEDKTNPAIAQLGEDLRLIAHATQAVWADRQESADQRSIFLQALQLQRLGDTSQAVALVQGTDFAESAGGSLKYWALVCLFVQRNEIDRAWQESEKLYQLRREDEVSQWNNIVRPWLAAQRVVFAAVTVRDRNRVISSLEAFERLHSVDLEAAYQALNQRMNEAIRGLKTENDIAATLRLFDEIFGQTRLRTPTASPEIHVSLGNSYQRRNVPNAIYHYLTAKRLNPKIAIPKKFTHFEVSQEVRIYVGFHGYNNEEAVNYAFVRAVAAARAGWILDQFFEKELFTALRQFQLAVRAAKLRPYSPELKMFVLRQIRWTTPIDKSGARSDKIFNDAKRLVSATINSPRLTSSQRSTVAEDWGYLLTARAKSVTGVSAKVKLLTEAETLLLKANQWAPASPATLFNELAQTQQFLARLARDTTQPERSATYFRRASVNYYTAAKLLRIQTEYALANRRDWERAINNPWPRMASLLAQMGHGNMLVSAGRTALQVPDVAKAKEFAQQAAAEARKDFRLAARASQLLFDCGQRQEAIRLLKESIPKAPARSRGILKQQLKAFQGQ